MSPLEPQMRNVLRDRAAAIQPPAPPLRETLEAGHAARVRRRRLISAVVAVAGVAVVVGGAFSMDALTSSTGPSGGPATNPTSSPSSDQPNEPSDTNPTPEPSLGRITACRDLPILPQDTEIDTTLAWDIQQLMISYTDPDSAQGAQRTFVLDFGDDPTCRSRPDALKLINHALVAGGHPTMAPAN